MVNARDVRKQLRRIGADYHFWGVAELRELPHILFENEQIRHIINGRYSGGFATLCATDIRVLLIDKKPLFLTMEDVRYDMVSDVMFNHRLLNASIILGTVHNSITFIGFNKTKLRQMTNFIQERVMAYRRHQTMHQQTEQLEPAAVQPYEMPALQLESSEGQQMLPTAFIEASTYPAEPVAASSDMPARLPINPYNMPIKIRRRTSKFY